MVPLFVAGGLAAVRILPVAAAALRAGTSAVGGFLRGSPSRGAILATGAATVAVPVGLKVIENESGGRLSQAAYDFTVSTLKEKIKEGMSVQDVERKMEAMSYIMDVNSAFKKGAQSIYVSEIMHQNEGADAIKKGKIAAISFQLLPDNMLVLTAKQGVRAAIADDMFKGDKNAADKYLANSLIDDIVKNAQVRALDGNQVSRDDVRKTLTEIINNPDKHPVASKFFSDRGRLMNGLKQIWPELIPESRTAPVTATPPTQTQDDDSRRDRPRSRLNEAFSMAADDGGILKVIMILMAAFMQMFGLGKGLSGQFAAQASPEQPVPQGDPQRINRPVTTLGLHPSV